MKNSVSKIIMNGLALVCMLAGSVSIQAQLNEQISVDGKYVPEVISVDRIYAFPTLPDLSVNVNNLTFERQGVIADWQPHALTMPALTWNASRTGKPAKGYVDLSLGSWLNSNLSAGYRFLQSETTTVGLLLQGNSTSLWRPKSASEQNPGKRFRYDYTLGAYGNHRFENIGQLSADLSWRTAWFNYYDIEPHTYTNVMQGMPTQTLNDINGAIGWMSGNDGKLNWSAALSYRGFHYRDVMMPVITVPFYSLWNARGTRENHFALSGEVNSRSQAKSAVVLEVEGDMLIYRGDSWSEESYYAMWQPRNYGAVFLRPYWRLHGDMISLRVGAEGALTFNARGVDENKRYGVFHVSPDVRVDFTGKRAAVYIHALGGTRLNTLASLSELDYYQAPVLLSTLPTYSPLDARVGVNLGPWAGFKTTIEFRYAFENNTPVGGWYMASCDYPLLYLPSYLDRVSRSLHGGAVKVKFGYDYGTMLSVRSEFSWQPQKGSIGIFNGYDRPKYVAGVSALYRPMSKLSLNADWQLRACRGIYTYDRQCVKLPNISLLNFGASYSITDKMSLTFRAANILNRNEMILPYQPTEGVTFYGGLQFVF